MLKDSDFVFDKEKIITFKRGKEMNECLLINKKLYTMCTIKDVSKVWFKQQI